MALTLNEVKKSTAKKVSTSKAEAKTQQKETLKPWSKKTKKSQTETRHRKFGKHIRRQATLSELDNVQWMNESDEILQLHIGLPIRFFEQTRDKFQKLSERRKELAKKIHKKLPKEFQRKIEKLLR